MLQSDRIGWRKLLGRNFRPKGVSVASFASLSMDSLEQMRLWQREQPLQGSFRLAGPSDFVGLQTHGEDRLQLMFGLYRHCTLHIARKNDSPLPRLGVCVWGFQLGSREGLRHECHLELCGYGWCGMWMIVLAAVGSLWASQRWSKQAWLTMPCSRNGSCRISWVFCTACTVIARGKMLCRTCAEDSSFYKSTIAGQASLIPWPKVPGGIGKLKSGHGDAVCQVLHTLLSEATEWEHQNSSSGVGKAGHVWNMLSNLPHCTWISGGGCSKEGKNKPFQSVSTKASPQTLEKDT